MKNKQNKTMSSDQLSYCNTFMAFFRQGVSLLEWNCNDLYEAAAERLASMKSNAESLDRFSQEEWSQIFDRLDVTLKRWKRSADIENDRKMGL